MPEPVPEPTIGDDQQLALDTVIQLLDEADPEDLRFWVAVRYAADLLESWSRVLQDQAEGQ